MPHAEDSLTEGQLGVEVVRRPAIIREATWRFLGDRDAADRAYCLRFGVDVAPEALLALGGAWAYPLPAAPRR